jgi:hypothetical protein
MFTLRESKDKDLHIPAKGKMVENARTLNEGKGFLSIIFALE